MAKKLGEMSTAELGMLFPIIITQHNSEWKKFYEKESAIIKETVKEENIVRINHYGSTTIPDLLAKPTIDILLEIVETIDKENLISKIKSIGYEYSEQPSNPAPHMMFMKGYTPNGFKGQAFHLHVRYSGDWDELYFRDYLLKHSDLAKEYGALKYKLMEKFKNDREAYTQGKIEFIREITKDARKEFGSKYINIKETKMAQYNYILFDLDGTITNSKVGITKSVAYALEYFGVKVENLDSLSKFIGPPLKDSFIKHYGFSEKEAELAVQKYREYYSETGIYENAVYDGIEDLLKSLEFHGKTLILATSKPTIYAKKILEHFDLYKFFSFVAGSELNGERVAKEEVIAYALNKNNIEDLKKAIMIGDREHDIIGAKKVGIQSIGLLFGFGSRNELEKASADFIAETVDDIMKILI